MTVDQQPISGQRFHYLADRFMKHDDLTGVELSQLTEAVREGVDAWRPFFPIFQFFIDARDAEVVT